MIIVGLSREFFGGGLPHVRWQQGTVAVGITLDCSRSQRSTLLVARSPTAARHLTGIEAVSNAVSALGPPIQARNARHLLVTQGCIVAFLIAGISWFAFVTHAAPYHDGFPTVLSQEATLILGH